MYLWYEKFNQVSFDPLFNLRDKKEGKEKEEEGKREKEEKKIKSLKR